MSQLADNDYTIQSSHDIGPLPSDIGKLRGIGLFKPLLRCKSLSCRTLLATWAILSALWTIGVGYEICRSVSVQADMSRDVEHDLDSDLTFASCTGQCAQPVQGNAQFNNTLNESWSDIAATYFRFGSTDMAESAFGPPAVIFAAGLGWIVFSRRRRRRRVTENSYNRN